MIRFIVGQPESVWGRCFRFRGRILIKNSLAVTGMAQLQNIGFKTVAMALRNDSVEIDDPELKRQKNWRSFSEQKVKGFWQRRWKRVIIP